MKALLWLIVVLPFAGALSLVLAGRKLPRTISAIIGVGSVSLSAILTILVGFEFLGDTTPFLQVAWRWFDVDGLSPNIGFRLDTVSLIFIFIITFVGALIHLYSAEFMWEDKGFRRFFVFMNLFVGFMLVLVLGDNLLLLFLGWEGVGLCSYLLIGYWYKDAENGYAARKAFIVTRVGDACLAVSFYILFMTYNTLDIQEILNAAPGTWMVGSSMAVATAFLLLGGAVGKSAQLPLQTWLPDAMAAPSPVSALLHAATMVTAGVYLIARTHVLFEIAPIAQHTVAIIGAATLIIAGMSALYQHDIKKVLAYSTISQIGYMFLALGVGAWSAALFHFMIHAFFKALLFLGAGAVIWVMRDEHNMFKMGGLWKKLPIIFWTFLIASASLSALPLITAGYYSKDKIIWLSYASEKGSIGLWLAAIVGAFITALYTFRMVFLTFFGESHAEPTHRPGWMISFPLVVLAFFSFAGGFIELPENMGHLTLVSDFVEKTLPATSLSSLQPSTELIFELIAGAVAIGAVYFAYRLFFNKSFAAAEPQRNAVQRFFYKGWDFDLFYDKLIVEPMVFLSKINKNDYIDQFYSGLVAIAGQLNSFLSATQNGQLRWYAMAIAAGAIIILTIIFFP